MGCKFDDFEAGVIDDLLQFQTGGSGDERQYFTRVTAGDSGLVVTSYRLAETGDIARKETFSEYTVIDTVTLSKSLSSQNVAAASAAGSVVEPVPAAGGFAWWWVAAACAAVLIAAGTALLVCGKRKTKVSR